MYTKRKCVKCGQPATHKFTRIEKGQIYDVFLCAEHAAEESPYQKPKGQLSDILEGLLKKDLTLKASGPNAPPALRCANCGLPFEAYRKNLLLGCSECYASFHDFLIPDLRKFHGDTHHLGRRPGGGQALPAERDFVIPDLADESASLAPKEPLLLGDQPPGPPPLGAGGPVGGPVEEEDPEMEIDELTRIMHRAIAEEDYPRAAECRDQIRDLKARQHKSKSSGE